MSRRILKEKVILLCVARPMFFHLESRRPPDGCGRLSGYYRGVYSKRTIL